MFGAVEVLGGVLVFRAVTAAYVAATEAQSQVNPRISRFQAFLTALSAGLNLVNLFYMGAGGRHMSPFLRVNDGQVSLNVQLPTLPLKSICKSTWSPRQESISPQADSPGMPWEVRTVRNAAVLARCNG